MVGKLWFTILLLVSAVLSILMVLLLQSLEQFNLTEAETQLQKHAAMVASIYEEQGTEPEGKDMISKYGENFATNIAIFEDGQKVWGSENHLDVMLPPSWFTEDDDLVRVLQEEAEVVKEVYFSLPPASSNDEAEMMVVGVPLSGQTGSGVFMYQTLSAIEETSNETRRLVYLSAGIAIILTTFFAFFLSSRVTAPLRKMRQAALEVAEGNFQTKVPILTHDEIGQLAIAFNRMRRELNRNIAALNQEKEQLARILSSMADGVMTFNRKGEVVVMNPPAERFFEDWRYEMESNSSKAGNLPEEMNELFQKVVEEEHEELIELLVQGRSWAILMAPLYDQEDVRGAVAVIRDMTEERLHDKLRKDFIANVSHELRTPISLLQGYSEAIVDDVVGSEEDQKEIARIIYDESLRMGRLVNELLDLARMEAGHTELNKTVVNLEEFSERIIRKFQGSANEDGLNLITHTVGSHPDVLIDVDRMEQVLTNLLHNAIRHTEQGGTVALNVKLEADHVEMDVTDTGSGIKEEDLPFVFERFYKGDKARTRGRSGTGLGLAITKNIVEAHQGELSVHSKMNKGTTFSMILPRKSV
ncbi:two-component system sensor histidine kinase ResE [Alkalicoccobacillus murimartini]|uniref:histidine kinase n=1 Tax=Alkalicoccobacillus murimartini TaxID=171685 RepID=A0ABT9YDE7_9BACI|nr:two-component system sensor histidine kinase ResE [Alkalicoccobacillus murimartini]